VHPELYLSALKFSGLGSVIIYECPVYMIVVHLGIRSFLAGNDTKYIT